MNLNPQDLEQISDLTLEHSNQRADDFWEGPIAVRERDLEAARMLLSTRTS